MKKIFFNAKIESLKIHPEVLKTYQDKNLNFLKIGMGYKQLQHITVVKDGDVYLVIDGVSRYLVAQQIGLTELFCEELDITEQEVLDCRIRINQKTKKSIIEKCLEAEHMLGVLGKSQGKKREYLGFDNSNPSQDFTTVGHDRYQLTCAMLDLEMRGSTLRKLLEIFWSETKEDTGTLKLVDEGSMSINKAYTFLQLDKKTNEDDEELTEGDLEGTISPVFYKLFNRDSIDLSGIEDESIDLEIDSPPYLGQRIYRNQGPIPLGQESTVKEYIENLMKYYSYVKLKLKPNGVLVIIIGESYRDGGYKGVCTKLETALENDGWVILDSNIWNKSNPSPRPNKKGFMPAYEKIIVCTKEGADPTFNNEKSGKMIVKKSKPARDGSSRFYKGYEERTRTNVITTSVFDDIEFKHIDPDFYHQAPAPMEIYKTFIDAYSNAGDTVSDIFCGSGQGLDYALSNGRHVIGHDIDPESIAFCEKRLKMITDAKESTNLRIVA